MGRPLFHPCPNRPQLVSLNWMMAVQSLLEPSDIKPGHVQVDFIKSNVDQFAYSEAMTIGHHRHAVITDSVSSFPCGLEKSFNFRLGQEFSGLTHTLYIIHAGVVLSPPDSIARNRRLFRSIFTKTGLCKELAGQHRQIGDGGSVKLTCPRGMGNLPPARMVYAGAGSGWLKKSAAPSGQKLCPRNACPATESASAARNPADCDPARICGRDANTSDKQTNRSECIEYDARTHYRS